MAIAANSAPGQTIDIVVPTAKSPPGSPSANPAPAGISGGSPGSLNSAAAPPASSQPKIQPRVVVANPSSQKSEILMASVSEQLPRVRRTNFSTNLPPLT